MILQKYKLCHDQPCTSVFLSATTTAQNRQSGSGEHLISAASILLMMIAVNVNYCMDFLKNFLIKKYNKQINTPQ